MSNSGGEAGPQVRRYGQWTWAQGGGGGMGKEPTKHTNMRHIYVSLGACLRQGSACHFIIRGDGLAPWPIRLCMRIAMPGKRPRLANKKKSNKNREKNTEGDTADTTEK